LTSQVDFVFACAQLPYTVVDGFCYLGCYLLMLLQVGPEQLGPALAYAPKVLGFSMQQLERRLLGLTWIQPDKQLLAQVGKNTPSPGTASPSTFVQHCTSTTLAYSLPARPFPRKLQSAVCMGCFFCAAGAGGAFAVDLEQRPPTQPPHNNVIPVGHQHPQPCLTPAATPTAAAGKWQPATGFAAAAAAVLVSSGE
jgi:hypothetical protein